VSKLIVGYVVLCTSIVGGVLLAIWAAGGFGDSGVSLYGKIALSLTILAAVVGGVILIAVRMSHPRDALEQRRSEPGKEQ
jgi:membrane protein implicated in regulation of membrane protease activity